MKKNQYKWALLFITTTIVITICVQIYSNIKNYQNNKKELIKQVQISLDNAVDSYYYNVAQGVISLTSQDANNPSKTKTDTLHFKNPYSREIKASIDSTLNSMIKKDSTKTYIIETKGHRKGPFKRIYNGNQKLSKQLNKLISKVYISYTRDSLNIKKLNTYVKKELNRKDIHFKYALSYKPRGRAKDSLKTSYFNFNNFPEKHLTTSSESHYLPRRGGKLKIHFTDETILLLKRSLIEILLSLLLSISIIASLLYLLRTIHRQKKVAAIKNDLISNITHEFKTPIATVSAALEGIKNFNELNDTSKTEKYINISAEQLGKLNEMVEKLLDTAVLHSEDLVLNTSKIDLIYLLQKITQKHRLITPDKQFSFKSDVDTLAQKLDEFHIENALDNIIDNAVKYGGSEINIEITSTSPLLRIKIKDNGKGIKKAYALKVFEQFYRIPTGNVHDTKGFGIGLYYSKKIIEKHNGKIFIDLNDKTFTTFIIELKK